MAFARVEIGYEKPRVALLNIAMVARVERNDDGTGTAFMIGSDGAFWHPLTAKGLRDICAAVGLPNPECWETEDLPDGT